MAQQATLAAGGDYPARRGLRAQTRHARADVRGRARHASRRADGFGRLLAWTTAGALVPGLGFLVAGRRRLGGVLLGLVAVALLALGLLLATGRLVSLGLRLAVRPDALLLAAVAFVVVGVVWVVVIVASHVSLLHRLRRFRLTRPQHVLAGVLVAALVAAVAVPSATAARYAMTQRSLVLNVFDDDGVERDPGLAGPDATAQDPWEGTPRINVLLLGSDAGEDREGIRPDTIITASIDTQTGDTVLFSLPRNLERAPFPAGTPGDEEFPNGFYCPGHQECLLNGVWTWAENNADLFPGVAEPGLTATRQVVGETLGLSIDYYALVDLRGFEDVVNALGGLQIDVEERLPIGGGFNQVTGRENEVTGYIYPGRQVLDGYEALWYARSRAGSTDGDYDRIRRQRCVIAAAVDQANPVNLARAFPRLASSAEQNVETDIGAAELDAFVELGLRVQSGELQSLPFTDDVITSADPDFALIQQLVQDAIDPPPPAPSTNEPAPRATASEPTAPPQDEEAADPAAPAVDPEAAQDVDEVCGA